MRNTRYFSGCVLLELRGQGGLRNRTDNLVHQLPVLEEEDGWNGANLESAGGLYVGVNVQLQHLCAAVVLTREFVEHGRNHAARPAPGGPEIDHCKPAALLHL